jgi:glycogen debranching enzyme
VAEQLIILDGSTFFYSDPNGDLEATQAEGYFHDDVRHLSVWRLLVDGRPLRELTSRLVDYYSARIVVAPEGKDPPFSVRRDRFVSDGVHEDIVLTNHSPEERRLTLEVCFGSDFADVLEAQQAGAHGGATSVELRKRSATLALERDGFRRGTAITFSAHCTLRDDRAIFDLVVEPHGEWRTCADIVPIEGRQRRAPLLKCDSFGSAAPELPLSQHDWIAQAPELDADWDDLCHLYEQSLRDLAALRLRPREEHLRWAMPAGGVPWYMTVFGRDSLIAAYEALPFQPTLAEATLETLAHHQATEEDDFRDAEPGKIMHELRRGKLVELGIDPHGPYYGTHDATLLFLILLDEYERWSGDAKLARKLEEPARRAVAWLDDYADRDGDGFLEYQSRSAKGLTNHCWKDSDDAIQFADGHLAEGPIATCEIQGYAYDARLRVARLARELWGDEDFAARQEEAAQELRERFDGAFWNEDLGFYVLALDGEKRQVDSVTSNPGHLLWSGIVSEERAQRVADRLLEPDLFSGWGIRCLSTEMRGFSPLKYHNGTVWPHDSAICAAGMQRYGFDEHAGRVAHALLDAAVAFGHQLPEVFGGFERDETNIPVAYPDALQPQAWAAAAPLLLLRTLLGLEVVDGKLRSKPHVPEELGRIRLRRIPVGGGRADSR